MRAWWMALLGVALALTGLPLASAAAAEPPSGFQDTTVFEGLQEPTAFAFAADGRVFIAEKAGRILVYEGLGDTEPTVFANLAKQVFDYGDKGILGLALDPAFDAGRPYVYVLYTYDHVLGQTPREGEVGWAPRWGQPPTYVGDHCPEPLGACVVSGRLVRLTAGAATALPTATEPAQNVLIEDWCQQFSSHSIGDLKFGPEGALFVSGGEGASWVNSDFGQYGNPCGDPPGPAGTDLEPPQAEGGSLRSQDARTPADPTGLDGAVLRVSPEDGGAWPGNPLAASPDPNARKIIGYGFRNPFRFAIDPRDGSIYVNNVGKGTYEEIDRFPLDPAQPYNSGWPCYEGPGTEPLFASLGLDACQRLYEEPGATSPPLFYYSHAAPVTPGDPCSKENGSAISGSAFYEGSDYPAEYRDALFFADAVRGCIYVMKADADGEPDPTRVEPFLAEEGIYPAVDIEQGPGGDLFYASLYGGPENGTIHRISYDRDAPRARLEVGQAWGPLSQPFEFDASASSGPAGDPLSFAWDLDGNGTFETTGGTTQSRAYASPANVRVAVRVTDGKTGKSSVAALTVYPGDSPPQVTIAEPTAALTWGVTQVIQFAGEAKAQQGSGERLNATHLFWKLRLLHCPFAAGACHEHPLQVFPATEGGDFAAPDHDYPSALKLFLTATDNRGLQATRTVEIEARAAPIGFESDPPGVVITASSKAEPAPFELVAIESSPITVSAPETATIGARQYRFDHWSDGGPRVHTVIAGRGGPYEAIYQAIGGEEAAPGTRLPRTRLLSHPPKRTRRHVARFTFASDLAGSRFQCRLDRGSFERCRSPRLYRHLKWGRHRIAVRALSPAGKPDRTPARYGWRIVRGAHHPRRHH